LVRGYKCRWTADLASHVLPSRSPGRDTWLDIVGAAIDDAIGVSPANKGGGHGGQLEL